MTRKATPDILGDILSAATVSRETAGADSDVLIYRVPLAKVRDNPFQTRTQMDPEHVLQLARSIADLKTELPATHGLQQPPMARLQIDFGHGLEPVPPTLYNNGAGVKALLQRKEVVLQLAFGHSRLRAFRLLSEGPDENWPEAGEFGGPLDADYAHIPVMISQIDDLAMWRHAVIENRARKNISAIEEALSLRQAMSEFGMTTEAAAETFGWQRSTAANKLRLLNLPQQVQDAIVHGVITEKHGRQLLQLVEMPAQLILAYEKTICHDLSVRDLQQWIDSYINAIEVIPFDTAWEPHTENKNVLGACAGCKHFVMLRNQPRCNNQPCYVAKRKLWVERKLTPSAAPAPAPPAADTEGEEQSVHVWVREEPAPAPSVAPALTPAPVSRETGASTPRLSVVGESITITISRPTAVGLHAYLKTGQLPAAFANEIQAALDAHLDPPPSPEQPKRVSTDWQNGWTDADQMEYDRLSAARIWQVSDITRPAVCLRLIENEEADFHPALWSRHERLINKTV